MPASDGGDDLIGVLGPAEGFWVFSGLLDDVFDGGLEGDNGVEHATLEPAVGQLGEEALDGVGTPRSSTHDYKRNGTTTLFAAFGVLEGSVIERCMQRHTHQEFIRFLNVVENQVPASKQVPVVLDRWTV